jgi:hypothetical protein
MRDAAPPAPLASAQLGLLVASPAAGAGGGALLRHAPRKAPG